MRAVPSRPPRLPPRGFTLLEILVVLVIIAVMTTVAILSIGVLGSDRGLDEEGDRYTDVVAAASEQAELEGRDYGIWIGPGRYQVYAFSVTKQLWEPLPDDRMYEEHELPGGLTVELEVEGRPVALGLDKPNQPRVPQVFLFASGDSAPYRLTLGREGSEAKWLVDGQPDGTLTVTHPGTQP